MRQLFRALLAAGLGTCAAVLVACGQSNGLLASNDASGLNSQLDAVSTAVSKHRCQAALSGAATLQQKAAALPISVDAKLRASLREGAATVAARAAKDCAKEKTTTTTETVPTTTETVTTETTPTTATTTTTPPTTPTTTPTTTPVPTTPPTTPTTTPSTPGGAGTVGGGATTP